MFSEKGSYKWLLDLELLILVFCEKSTCKWVGETGERDLTCSDMIDTILAQNQRKLQLQIEQQGQKLQMMLERNIEDNRIRASTSAADDHSAPPSRVNQPSLIDRKSETSNIDQVKAEVGISNVNTVPEDGSWDLKRKEREHETQSSQKQEPGAVENNAPPTKRVRAD